MAERASKRRDPIGGRGAAVDPWGAREGSPLPASFYGRPAPEVARDLLGKILVSTFDERVVAGRIVETEAYIGPEDEASHAAARIGRTARNEPMFGPAGRAYVYRIYGIHWCMNAVTGDEGHPSAVLLRAAEPLDGMDTMRQRRGVTEDRNLMRGPGNLCQALGVTGALNHHPLDRLPLQIVVGPPVDQESVQEGPRIGITRAIDLPLRFWIRSDPWVSRTR
jgi:DNA-3-methyladenine glycosylase